MPTPAGPNTNDFRCNACGRYFNTEAELAEHSVECLTAKQATPSGQATLERDLSQPHAKNDADSKEHPFEHGTQQS